jgi:Fe-S-cluster containining protein
MQKILDDYRCLLAAADAWFARCQRELGEAVVCASGCSGCCRGLFDITLLDALLLRSEFERLPAEVQAPVRVRAKERLDALQTQWPGFVHPWILNLLPDRLWTEMPEEDITPCPLLGDDGRCLVYAGRPLTCRLHGLPQVDRDGFVFDERYCNRNFAGSDPLALAALRSDFKEFYRREFALLHRFGEKLIGVPLAELDTFIPAALCIDFSGFDWHGWGMAQLSRLTREDKDI